MTELVAGGAAVVEADAIAAVAVVAAAAASASAGVLAARFLVAGCSSCQFAYVAEWHVGPSASVALLGCEAS